MIRVPGSSSVAVRLGTGEITVTADALSNTYGGADRDANRGADGNADDDANG